MVYRHVENPPTRRIPRKEGSGQQKLQKGVTFFGYFIWACRARSHSSCKFRIRPGHRGGRTESATR